MISLTFHHATKLSKLISLQCKHAPYGSSQSGTQRPTAHVHENHHKTNPAPSRIAEVPLASDKKFCHCAAVLPRPYIPSDGIGPNGR